MRVAKSLLPSGVKSHIRQLAWQQLGLKWTTTTGIPLEITSPADWEIYNEIFVDGEYDDAISDTLHAAGDGPCQIVDIGSNLGFFSLRVLDRARRHQAEQARDIRLSLIEGSPSVWNKLRGREAFTALKGARATFMEGLAGNRTGHGTLYESTVQHHFSSTTDTKVGMPTEVPYLDLVTEFESLERISLIKCDIQGGEEQLLLHQLPVFKKADAIVIELHHFLCNTGKCMSMLASLGLGEPAILRTNSAITVAYYKKNGN